MLIKNVGPLSLSMMTVFMLYTESARARSSEFTVQHHLRETPSDSASDVAHRAIIGLFEDRRNGDNVAREVAILTIHELDENGDVIYLWRKGYPTVDTTDGFWWIEHADPDDPVMAEFVFPPRLYGTALAPGVSDLDFDIEGNVYTQPPGGPPFQTTGLLDSSLPPLCMPGICGCAPDPPRDPLPSPKKNESDEPVEMPNEPATRTLPNGRSDSARV